MTHAHVEALHSSPLCGPHDLPCAHHVEGYQRPPDASVCNKRFRFTSKYEDVEAG